MNSKEKAIASDAKSPDVFLTLSERALKFFEKNIVPTASTLGILLVVGIGFAGRSVWVRHSEESAGASLYKFQAEIEKIRDEENQKAESAKLPEPPKVDFDKVYKAAVEPWIEELKKHASTVAGKTSAIQLAGFLASHDQYELAKSALEPYSRKDMNLLSALISIQRGSLLTEAKDWAGARELFDAVLKNGEAKFLHPLASMRLGLVYAEEQQWDRAQEILGRVASENPESEMSAEARAFLRLIKLKQTRSEDNPKGSKG